MGETAVAFPMRYNRQLRRLAQSVAAAATTIVAAVVRPAVVVGAAEPTQDAAKAVVIARATRVGTGRTRTRARCEARAAGRRATALVAARSIAVVTVEHAVGLLCEQSTPA